MERKGPQKNLQLNLKENHRNRATVANGLGPIERNFEVQAATHKLRGSTPY